MDDRVQNLRAEIGSLNSRIANLEAEAKALGIQGLRLREALTQAGARRSDFEEMVRDERGRAEGVRETTGLRLASSYADQMGERFTGNAYHNAIVSFDEIVRILSDKLGETSALAREKQQLASELRRQAADLLRQLAGL